MPIQSAGSTIPTTWASPYEWSGGGSHPLSKWLFDAHSYDRIYETQPYVTMSVNKLVGLHVVLPFKVYEREVDGGRTDARLSPFGRLINRPSSVLDKVQFWAWFFGMYHVHGRSFARKIRDRGGRPVELELTHPTRMRFGPEGGGATGSGPGPDRWWFTNASGNEERIDRSEFIYWRRFAPSAPTAGLAPLEPLRQTLENESASRRAELAKWRNGGKPSIVLEYPGKFTNPATAQRISDSYQNSHGGVDNWNKPLVIQEGMTAKAIDLPKDLGYIEGRKLDREEVAGVYDIPPPAIQILDKATFSNITEQMRMLYRQTMPPHLTSFEAMIDFDLRDGRLGDPERAPDFGEQFYFESLVDGVLRGTFEERMEALTKGVQNSLITPAEGRAIDNRPFIEGSDRLFINSAVVPLDDAGQQNAGPQQLPQACLDGSDFSTVMGRLGRVGSLDDIDERLVKGLAPAAAKAVMGAVDIARYGDCTVADLIQIIKQIGTDQ